MPDPRGRGAPPITFRLYPQAWNPSGSRGALYAIAYVWPTPAAMQAHRRARGWRGYVDAHVWEVERRSPSGRIRPCFAELHVCRPRLGVGLLTHELLHVTFAWARRRGIDLHAIAVGEGDDRFVHRDEEALCYTHGELMRQFVTRATRLGLYGD